MEGESTSAFGNSGSGTILLTDWRVPLRRCPLTWWSSCTWLETFNVDFSGGRRTIFTAELHMNHSYYSMTGPSTDVGMSESKNIGVWSLTSAQGLIVVAEFYRGRTAKGVDQHDKRLFPFHDHGQHLCFSLWYSLGGLGSSAGWVRRTTVPKLITMDHR